ncbi:hypothetical protein GCM10009109_23770 [Marinobacterium sediminicola]
MSKDGFYLESVLEKIQYSFNNSKTKAEPFLPIAFLISNLEKFIKYHFQVLWLYADSSIGNMNVNGVIIQGVEYFYLTLICIAESIYQQISYHSFDQKGVAEDEMLFI